MKKYIITGVTSFLGRYLAQKLISDGNDVFGVVRPTSKNIDTLENIKGLKIIKTDLDTALDAKDLFAKIYNYCGDNINSWIHFAWDGEGSVGRSNPQIQEKNVGNAKKSFFAAQMLGAKKFVFSGSQAEYGNGSKDEPNPVSEYGKAKFAFGSWAQSQKTEMEYIHLRIYSVFGVGDHYNSLVNACVRTFLEDKEMIMGPCNQMWNYMYIRDCADALAMIAEKDNSVTGVIEIASATSMKLKEYVLKIWNICGEKGICSFGKRLDNAEGAVDLIPDIRKLSQLGFVEKYVFDDGIKEIVKNYTQAKR